jgi:hypothetical protein
MHNIKYIVAVGTSFTAGGGFEEISTLRPIMQKWESRPLPETMFECSWPGQLQQMLKPGIKVINLGRPGAGYEYLIRVVEEWIINNPGKVEDTLFLLETSALGRSEFWDNEQQQFIVCNWERRGDIIHTTLHSGQYWLDSHEKAQAISKNEALMSEWMTKFINYHVFLEKAEYSMYNFFCKLNHLNYSFAHFGEPFHDQRIIQDSLIRDSTLLLVHNSKKINSIHEYLEHSKLTITDFTNGEAKDFHACLDGNRSIALQYYLQLKKLYNI